MYKMISFLVLSLSSTLSFAGSDTVDCKSLDGSIVFSVGNGSNTIQIKYKDEETKKDGVYSAPVTFFPDYDYNNPDSTNGEIPLNVFPTENKKIKSTHNTQLFIKHADGTSCYGRQFWDDTFTQNLMITAKDNGRLMPLFYDKKIKNLSVETGYIYAKFSCHSYGATSPGGCYFNEGDEATEVPVK